MDEKHTQLKVKCLTCNLHFILCTEHPERHNAKTLYCPECGHHAGEFATWTEVVAGPIYKQVPGNAKPAEMTEEARVKMIKAGDIEPTH